MSRAELVLHPVRLRIAQALLGDRRLTTSDLREELADVPTATLYRQVALLVEGGVLEVVDERRVRGAVERTYRLGPGGAVVNADDAATMDRESHAQAFLAFVAGLLADFDRYLDGEEIDVGRDLVGYRQVALHLSDAELRGLIDDLQTVVAPRLALRPGKGRTRRLFSTVLMPGEPPSPPAPPQK